MGRRARRDQTSILSGVTNLRGVENVIEDHSRMHTGTAVTHKFMSSAGSIWQICFAQRLSPTIRSPIQSLIHERHAFAYTQDPASVQWQSGVETKVSTPIEVSWRKIDSGKNPRKDLIDRPRHQEDDKSASKASSLSQSFQTMKSREVIRGPTLA